MEAHERAVLRHCLATLAYRGGKVLRGAPDSFADHDTGGGVTPLGILAHLGDLLEWSLSMVRGQTRWVQAAPGSWASESARFHDSLAALDSHLASDAPAHAEWSRLLQGPIADALTHVGQLAMLRRMTGSPTPGENYYVADIVAGRVGPGQSPPRKPL
jgi:hypothetical protein